MMKGYEQQHSHRQYHHKHSPSNIMPRNFVSRMSIMMTHDICTLHATTTQHLFVHSYFSFRSLFVLFSSHSFICSNFQAAFFRGDNTHFHWSIYIARNILLKQRRINCSLEQQAPAAPVNLGMGSGIYCHRHNQLSSKPLRGAKAVLQAQKPGDSPPSVQGILSASQKYREYCVRAIPMEGSSTCFE